MASSVEDIGDCVSSLGRHADARAAYSEALEIWRVARPDSTHFTHTLNSLALAHEKLGELDIAIDLYGQVVERSTKLLGPDHADVAVTLSNKGAALFRKGNKKEAEELVRRSLDIVRKAVGAADSRTLGRIGNLAFIMEDRGDFGGAEPLHREFLEAQRKLVGPDDPAIAGVLARLGSNLLEQGRPAEAEPVLRESLAIRLKNESDVWTTFNIQSMLGGALLAQTKYIEAEPLLLAGYEGMEVRADKIPPQFRQVRLADALDRLRRLYEALHHAEPGRGDDSKAAVWKAKWESAIASTQPTATAPAPTQGRDKP